MDQYKKDIEELKSKIKSFPDFPKKGILYWEIFTALQDGKMCKLLQSLLITTIKENYPDIEAIVGLQSRGYLFAFSVAAELGIPCLPVRKKGKVPGEVESISYELEYGTDEFHFPKNSIKKGLKCLLIDDLIATGGSLEASAKLLSKCGADILGCLVVIELVSLNGWKKLPGLKNISLIQYD